MMIIKRLSKAMTVVAAVLILGTGISLILGHAVSAADPPKVINVEAKFYRIGELEVQVQSTDDKKSIRQIVVREGDELVTVNSVASLAHYFKRARAGDKTFPTTLKVMVTPETTFELVSAVVAVCRDSGFQSIALQVPPKTPDVAYEKAVEMYLKQLSAANWQRKQTWEKLAPEETRRKQLEDLMRRYEEFAKEVEKLKVKPEPPPANLKLGPVVLSPDLRKKIADLKRKIDELTASIRATERVAAALYTDPAKKEEYLQKQNYYENKDALKEAEAELRLLNEKLGAGPPPAPPTVSTADALKLELERLTRELAAATERDRKMREDTALGRAALALAQDQSDAAKAQESIQGYWKAVELHADGQEFRAPHPALAQFTWVIAGDYLITQANGQPRIGRINAKPGQIEFWYEAEGDKPKGMRYTGTFILTGTDTLGVEFALSSADGKTQGGKNAITFQRQAGGIVPKK